jgi:pyridoxamine 5'-phosphate oxidase
VRDPEATLDPAAVDPDPLVQLQRWLDEEAAEAADSVAMLAVALATATPDGAPSVRYVLLRGVAPDGLCFFTNRDSRKGRELAANARASMALYWPRLGRQVRADGSVEQLGDDESAAYFRTRPVASRHAAWASRQSDVVRDRADLERAFADAAARYGEDVPLPPFWGATAWCHTRSSCGRTGAAGSTIASAIDARTATRRVVG